jgi:hypothetical protein
MSQKTKNITGWVLTAFISLVFIGSAAMKFTGGEEGAKTAASMGLSASTIQIIALVEIGSLLLFIFPRTGVLGTLLLAAYLGGAIATHLEHPQPIVMPVVIQALVWITAIIRFPELSKRLADNKTPGKDRATLPSTRLAHA